MRSACRRRHQRLRDWSRRLWRRVLGSKRSSTSVDQPCQCLWPRLASVSLASQTLSSASCQCQRTAFVLPATLCAASVSLAVATWLKLWASTHTLTSIASSAPASRYSPHRPGVSTVSSLPSAGACSCHAAAPTRPGTQPIAFSSLDHTGLSGAFAPPTPRPSKFAAFYFTRQRLGD